MLKDNKDGAFAWETYAPSCRFGRLIVKELYYVDMDGGRVGPSGEGMACVERSRWVSKPAWKFTENKDGIMAMIPKYE